VFGVDFFSVISRGSQFKVESFMFRIGKPESLVFLSPSKQDVSCLPSLQFMLTSLGKVGKQNAAECMPLIMEPLSAFYNGPLVVLDFQSLYPSIMIAYNYCYSTCLGRVANFKGRNKFGVTELDQTRGLLETLEGHINSESIIHSSITKIHTNLFLNAFSCTERDYVCEAISAQRSTRQNVDRVIGDTGYGQAGHEERERGQGKCRKSCQIPVNLTLIV
jgi:DNA polymerase elongation subunit (family B)